MTKTWFFADGEEFALADEAVKVFESEGGQLYHLASAQTTIIVSRVVFPRSGWQVVGIPGLISLDFIRSIEKFLDIALRSEELKLAYVNMITHFLRTVLTVDEPNRSGIFGAPGPPKSESGQFIAKPRRQMRFKETGMFKGITRFQPSKKNNYVLCRFGPKMWRA